MNKEQLREQLPHGSGINGDWHIEEQTDKYIACNVYEPMNEAGFYDGVAHFTLIIPKDETVNFVLHFNGRQSQYLNQKHLLRDYLEDTFASCLMS